MRIKKFFLDRETITYGLIAALVVCAATAFYSFYSCWSQNTALDRHLFVQACRIESLLNSAFEDATQRMIHVGKKISKVSLNNSSQFSQIIKEDLNEISATSPTAVHYKLRWRPDDIALNLSKAADKDLPLDSYLWQCRQSPWQLHLSNPAINIPGGLWEIPGGMGISSPQGKVLGTLAIGFNIAELNARIQKEIAGSSVSFVVLDGNYEVTLQSPDNSIEFQNSYYRDVLKGGYSFHSEGGKLKDSILYKDISYSSYKKMRNYPYLILTGYNTSFLSKEIISSVLSKVGEYSLICLLFLGILFQVHRKKIKFAASIDNSKDEFLKEFKSRKDDTLDFIMIHSELIHKYVSGDITIGIDKQKCLKLIENINEAAADLKGSLSRKTNFEFIEINSLMEECLNIIAPTVVRKGVTLIKDPSLERKLKPLYADELSLKQVVMGLVALSLHYTPKGGRIKVSIEIYKEGETSNRSSILNDTDFLVLKIEDTGIPLNYSDMQRLARKFDRQEWCWGVDGTDITMEAIEKVIMLHNGNFEIEAKESLGKIIKLAIPYRTKSELRPQVQPSNEVINSSTVVNFPIKSSANSK